LVPDLNESCLVIAALVSEPLPGREKTIAIATITGLRECPMILGIALRRVERRWHAAKPGILSHCSPSRN
jgi:hypothetical protein